MHTVHAGLSFAAAIQPGKIDTLNSMLIQFNTDPGNNTKLPLAKSATTHFASGIVIPEQNDTGITFPTTLMFFTSYTGPLNVHLDELISIGKPGLVELFANCIGFPENAKTSNEALKEYIKKHLKKDTFYTGMQCITHADIGNEQKLRMCIEDYMDANNSFQGMEGKDAEVKQKIQDYIGSKPEFSWAKQPYKKTFGDFWALWGSAIVTGICLVLAIVGLSFGISHFASVSFLLGLVIVLVALVVFVVTLLIFYRISELSDPYVAPRQPDDQVRKVMSTQNHPVINEMTIAGPLKKGWIHPISLNLVLRLVSKIRGILKIPTIATARWLTIDGGNRLIFISNFGNLSESYVRDFIDARGSASRINLLFGQGNGYPTTKWVMGAGALVNPDGFLNDVHKYQQITKFWYWPYMNLSIENINNNRQIRLGLFAQMDKDATRKWLQLF